MAWCGAGWGGVGGGGGGGMLPVRRVATRDVRLLGSGFMPVLPALASFGHQVINDELRVSKKKRRDLMAELKKLGFAQFAPATTAKRSKASDAADGNASDLEEGAGAGEDGDMVRG